MRLLFVYIALFALNSFAQIDESVQLIARNTGKKIVANGDTIRTMGFAQDIMANPNVPGPTLEFNEGDSIEIDLWNFSQGAPHTIHLHGLDVDQENDGVPHLSFSVPHLEHGYYKFKAPHAGTYLYHCHVVSAIHVQAGMYGLLIVHPSDGSQKTWDGGYDYDISMSMLMSEIDTIWHNDSIIKHDYDTAMTIHTVKLPEYEPQYYLINGSSDHQIADSSIALNTAVGAINYLRLANVGYKGNRIVFPASMGAQIIDSDGRPLPTVEVSDTLVLLPGERYGVLGTFNAELTDMITVEYFDLNTMAVCDTQEVPVKVVGVWGIAKNEYNVFKVFPNPTDGNLTIHFDDRPATEIRIYSVSGQLISRFPVLNTQLTTIDVSGLSKGAYILETVLEDQEVVRQTIVRN